VKVLALSPHTDDIELGCGGYLTKLHEQGHDIQVIVFSDCSTFWGHLPLRYECIRSLSYLEIDPVILSFEMRNFKRQDVLDILMAVDKPDLVLTPSGSDIHQDHQVVHNESVRAFSRECCVLGYELAWNARSFTPTYFVELSEKNITGKSIMLSRYNSQIDLHRPYFNTELIRGLARSRGLQIKKEYAEAFEVITWIEK